MEFGEKKFVKLIYLISQVFLACNFLNFLAHCGMWVFFSKYRPSFDFMEKTHVQPSSDFYIILHIFPLTCIILLRRNYNPHISIFQISWQEIEKKRFFFAKIWFVISIKFFYMVEVWSTNIISWTINLRKFQNWKI